MGLSYNIISYDSIGSTNDECKTRAKRGAEEWTVITAKEQTFGKGRAGHTFISPRGGLYLSVLLRPEFKNFTLITPAAAVAVCRAVKRLYNIECQIKWVNDIYKNGKKICGILTESSVADGWAVLGIGINLSPLPEGAVETAGSLFDLPTDSAEKLSLAVLEEFRSIYESLPQTDYIGEYRSRAYLKDKQLLIRGIAAEYIGVTDDFKLKVRYKDGKEELIDSGEIGVARTL